MQYPERHDDVSPLGRMRQNVLDWPIVPISQFPTCKVYLGFWRKEDLSAEVLEPINRSDFILMFDEMSCFVVPQDSPHWSRVGILHVQVIGSKVAVYDALCDLGQFWHRNFAHLRVSHSGVHDNFSVIPLNIIGSSLKIELVD